MYRQISSTAKNFHSAKSTGVAHPAEAPIVAQRSIR
jgi:hypothetical protein